MILRPVPTRTKHDSMNSTSDDKMRYSDSRAEEILLSMMSTATALSLGPISQRP